MSSVSKSINTSQSTEPTPTAIKTEEKKITSLEKKKMSDVSEESSSESGKSFIWLINRIEDSESDLSSFSDNDEKKEGVNPGWKRDGKK